MVEGTGSTHGSSTLPLYLWMWAHRRESWSGHAPTRGSEQAEPPRYALQTTRLHAARRSSGWPWQSPVGLNDFLSVSQSSFPVLYVQADAHGLVHHVQHIHVTVLKHGAHLLLAELADLQQLARGCCGVKEMTSRPTGREGSQGRLGPRSRFVCSTRPPSL